MARLSYALADTDGEEELLREEIEGGVEELKHEMEEEALLELKNLRDFHWEVWWGT
jgi:hypothetical protein